MPSIPLGRLLRDVEIVEVKGDPSRARIRDIAFDSSAVTAGSLFCCLPGAVHDGHDFAEEAERRGAAALLCERIVATDVPQARVRSGSVREAMARVSARFYGDPASKLSVIGITGTNGKTTVIHMLQSVLDRHGWPTGLIGTLGRARTTPESPVLQAALAKYLEAGKRAVAMEVSSHALVQNRVDCVRFAVVGFTNLSREHLDLHGTMEAYFAAKAELFSSRRAEFGVVDSTDPWGRRLIEAQPIPVYASGLGDASGLEVGLLDSRFVWRGARVELPMGGVFNVRNALVAATIAEKLGVPAKEVATGLSEMPRVSGRMEPVSLGQPFTVLVDYAHTPAGLKEVLETAAATTKGRLILVFGCGGDRDRGKRPEMGAVAVRMADVAVLTSDNPRTEDPLAIIADVRSGMDRADRRATVVEEPDRRAAIDDAVSMARPGDAVIVAGKGHETTQETREGTTPFDDRLVARAALERIAGGTR